MIIIWIEIKIHNGLLCMLSYWIEKKNILWHKNWVSTMKHYVIFRFQWEKKIV